MAGDYGSDLFGLDGFGDALKSLDTWAGPIGAGSQAIGAMAARKFFAPEANETDEAKKKSRREWRQRAELIGAGAGVVAGAGLWFAGKQSAGVSCALAALISGGIRHMERAMLKDDGVERPAYFGEYSISPMPVLRDSNFSGTTLMGGSLGMHTIENSAVLSDAPPQLVGNYGLADHPGASQVQIQGGPQISGLGAHFGATLFSS